MLWIQGFHVIFVVCWFAGIFYLPRILVYYAQSPDPETKAVLAVMARKPADHKDDVKTLYPQHEAVLLRFGKKPVRS